MATYHYWCTVNGKSRILINLFTQAMWQLHLYCIYKAFIALFHSSEDSKHFTICVTFTHCWWLLTGSSLGFNILRKDTSKGQEEQGLKPKPSSLQRGATIVNMIDTLSVMKINRLHTHSHSITWLHVHTQVCLVKQLCDVNEATLGRRYCKDFEHSSDETIGSLCAETLDILNRHMCTSWWVGMLLNFKPIGYCLSFCWLIDCLTL